MTLLLHKALFGVAAGGAPEPPGPSVPAIVSAPNWLAFYNAEWESAPPESLVSVAQNEGILDNEKMSVMTDWSGNGHHASRQNFEGVRWQSSGYNAKPTFRLHTSTASNAGYTVPTAPAFNPTGISTVVIAAWDRASTGNNNYIYVYKRDLSSFGVGIRRGATDRTQIYSDTFSTSVLDEPWAFSNAEARMRLIFVEVDRTAATEVIRYWSNGIPSGQFSAPRPSGTFSHAQLFALPGGSTPLYGDDVGFIGVIDSALDQSQRDVISSYFTATYGEVAWRDNWSITEAPSSTELYHIGWESNPLLAPAAYRSRAQNSAILNLATMPRLTGWIGGNHLDQPISSKRAQYQSAAINSKPGAVFDRIDDAYASLSVMTLGVNQGIVSVAKPVNTTVQILLEHGPNSSATDGSRLVAVEPARVEFVYANKDTTPGGEVRLRSTWADGTVKLVSMQSHPTPANAVFNIDLVSSVTSSSNTATLTGSTTDALFVGSRLAGATAPFGGPLGILWIANNPPRAEVRVVEFWAQDQYDLNLQPF